VIFRHGGRKTRFNKGEDLVSLIKENVDNHAHESKKSRLLIDVLQDIIILKKKLKTMKDSL
jgi:hypothetical protein